MINDNFGSAPADFSVMNINIWKGGTKAFQGSVNEDEDRVKPKGALSKIAAYLSSNLSGLDGIVGLQEVYTDIDFADDAPDGIKDGTINEAEFIAEKLPQGWHAVTGPTRNIQIGRGANAILTNLKVEKKQVWKFAFDPTNQGEFGAFQRGALAIKLKFPGESSFPRKLWIVCTHLDGGLSEDFADPPGVVAIRQLFQALGHIKTFDPDFPVIFIGDFNIKKSHDQPFETLGRLMSKEVSGFQKVCSNLRMYIFLYDPNNRLDIMDADDRNDPEGRTFESVTFTDHAVLKADFRWRKDLNNAPLDF